MYQLSDTQLVILSAALQRNDHCVLPLPERLKGGAAEKVVTSLIGKGLIEEVDANRGDPIWRETGFGHGVTLVLTATGIAALGVEPDEAAQAATVGEEAVPVPNSPEEIQSPPLGATEPHTRKSREGTKQALMIERLRTSEGATIPEIVSITGWKSHTVRGAIAGALKKKMGLTILSEKDESRGSIYRIA